MYLYAVFVLIALLTGCAEPESMKGRVSVIPYAGVGDQSDNYSITAEGQNVPVNAWSHAGRTAHYAHFEFTRTVTLEITNKLGDFGASEHKSKTVFHFPDDFRKQGHIHSEHAKKIGRLCRRNQNFHFRRGPANNPIAIGPPARHTQHQLLTKLRRRYSPHFHERPAHVSFEPPEGGENGRSWNLSTGQHP